MKTTARRGRGRTAACLVLATSAVLAASAGSAAAAPEVYTEASDTPTGTSGKADLRKVIWDGNPTNTTLTVSIDDSSVDKVRADIGVHVLIDSDRNAIADHEIYAVRNADDFRIDVALRELSHPLSTADCQDLAGKAIGTPTTVDPTIADAMETFSFTFASSDLLVQGQASGKAPSFVWAAFGTAPPGAESAGPWDIMPDAADPAPQTANPGDRRCNQAKSGLSVRMSSGLSYAPAEPGPDPTPVPSPNGAPPPKAPPTAVVVLAGGEPRKSASATLDASGSKPGPSEHIVSYEWDFNSDGVVDANTGTDPTASIIHGTGTLTVGLGVRDSSGQQTTTTIIVPEVLAAAECEIERRIGIFNVTAGCIRLVDGVFHITGARDYSTTAYNVNVNGIALRTFNERNEITVNQAGRVIRGIGQWRIDWLNPPDGRPINLWDSGPSGFTWNLSSPDGHVRHIATLGITTRCPPDASCAVMPGGYGIRGELGISVDTRTFSAIFDVTVALTDPFDVSGGVALRVDPLTADIRLDSIHFSIDDADLGAVRLHPLSFRYEAPGTGEPMHEGDLWRVDVGLFLMSDLIEVQGTLIFIDGRFCYGGGEYRQNPGIPIYAGVFLNRFAGHFLHDCGRGGGNYGFGTGVGATFAAPLVEIEVDGSYERRSDGIFMLDLTGRLVVRDAPLAHAYTRYWSDGYFAWGGGINFSYPKDDDQVFRIVAEMNAWVEDAGPAGRPLAEHSFLWQADARGEFTLGSGFLSVSIAGRAYINQRYMAGCGIATVLTSFEACGYYDIARNEAHGVIGGVAGLTPYLVVPTRSRERIIEPRASLAQAAARTLTFDVARGQEKLNIAIAGTGGVPDVTLTDPSGRVYAPTPGQQTTVGKGFRSLAISGIDELVFGLDKPAGGEWTITPRDGSPAIKKVLGAAAAPKLRIAAKVTGKGRERTLTWRAPGLDGRTVRFVERGMNVGQTITSTRATRGRVKFSMQQGSKGARQIEALVASDGLPSPAVVVARFRAPGPDRPGRPGRVRLRRGKGQTLKVTWPRVRGADGYSLLITGSDSRRQKRIVVKPGVTLKTVRSTTSLKVAVQAWKGNWKLVGPPRRAKLKATAKPR